MKVREGNKGKARGWEAKSKRVIGSHQSVGEHLWWVRREIETENEWWRKRVRGSRGGGKKCLLFTDPDSHARELASKHGCQSRCICPFFFSFSFSFLSTHSRLGWLQPGHHFSPSLSIKAPAVAPGGEGPPNGAGKWWWRWSRVELELVAWLRLHRVSNSSRT